jgi:hypothetical protein
MKRSVGVRVIWIVSAISLLAGAACSSTPSDASISAGLSADVSLIRAAVGSGDRRTAIDLLHRLNDSVDGLARMGSLAPSRVAEIHAAVAAVLDALRSSRAGVGVTPTASPAPTTPSPTPDEHTPEDHGSPPDHGHGHDKPPKDDEKPSKD